VNPPEGRKSPPKLVVPLSRLTPAAVRDDATAFDLRYASCLIADAAAKGFTSEAALNSLRADAVIKPNAVFVSLDRRTLTQEMIDTARLVVAAVLDQIQSVAEAIS